MKKAFYIIYLFSLIGFISCSSESKPTLTKSEVSNKDWKLIKVAKSETLFVLFPCFPCDAQNTEIEFNDIKKLSEQGISIAYMNFNQRLWLNEDEKKHINSQLEQIKKEVAYVKNIIVGGFSSGGNVALLMSNYWKSKQLPITGVFVVDSPIDLWYLYNSAQAGINNSNKKEEQKGEDKWIIQSLEQEFGTDTVLLKNISTQSPYIIESSNNTNIQHLKNTPIQFYTEPDSTWWQAYSSTPYVYTNAYMLSQIAEQLKAKDYDIELIQTQNKGYRADGRRHPHSWSIVDVDKLTKTLRLERK